MRRVNKKIENKRHRRYVSIENNDLTMIDRKQYSGNTINAKQIRYAES